jgi:hypothetical protein
MSLRVSSRVDVGEAVLSFVALKAFGQGIESAFDRFGMAFEGTLTPSVFPILICQLDEQPSWKYPEILDALNFRHLEDGGAEAKRGNTDFSQRNRGTEGKKRNPALDS